VVIEPAGRGIDRLSFAAVYDSPGYALSSDLEIEALQFADIGGLSNSALIGNGVGQEIQGNHGNNLIAARGGNDTIWGWGGNDTFLFDSVPNAATNVDAIMDFNVANDVFHLEDGIFSSLSPGGLTADQFWVGTEAFDSGDRIIHNQAAGALSYDVDGAGGAAAVRFAQVTPGLSITHLDFVVV
jgi:Ca2+-binding RTX toxin-like protein